MIIYSHNNGSNEPTYNREKNKEDAAIYNDGVEVIYFYVND